MGVQGKPIVADDASAGVVGEWWARTLTLEHVTLRSELVRPPLFGRWARKDWMRPAMRDLVRHRGHAARLYLVAILEQQNLHPRSAKRWTAEPLLDRHTWRDRLSAAGELLVPSWASLLLGFTREPGRDSARKQWHRTRYEAVHNAFNRLAAIELFDPVDTVIHSEHREWRWNSRVVDRRYMLPQTTEGTFQVPSALFTSGAYLRLSGAALYSVLKAFEYDQLGHRETCFQVHGFTWQVLDSAQEQLRAARLPPTLTRPLGALYEARVAHEKTYMTQRPVSAIKDPGFPRVVQEPWRLRRSTADRQADPFAR